MLYTGGTTGMPKGVMYPAGAFAGFLLAMGRGLRTRAAGDMAALSNFLDQITEPPKRFLPVHRCTAPVYGWAVLPPCCLAAPWLPRRSWG